MTLVDDFIEEISDFENNHFVAVIIKKGGEDKAEWIYSESYVRALKEKCLVNFTRKSDRLNVIRKIIDLYTENKISVVSIHAAFFCLFKAKLFSMEFVKADGMNVKQIGIKRMKAFGCIPEIRVIPDHEFLMYQVDDIVN
ncbi:hypothetical protein P4562_21175 [Lysinibacillus xylanilyticus]|uniref:hypothetical protein n=1 Tax=Lysinibacillus xylanilyticus TaxID=582475 RepID=UPI002E1DC96A|nr:hypothetical protein [Lysinibacillus xylanilyticus]